MRLIVSVALSSLLLAGCASTRPDREPDEHRPDPLLADSAVAHAVVREVFVTARTPDDNIDSPAVWAAPDGKLWLFATSKANGRVMMYDGETGTELGRIGTAGEGPGQFLRPNGISVFKDLLFVVERDNHRVQLLSLPALEPLGSFGQDELLQPYGLWVYEPAPGQIEVLVSDAYMAGEYPNGDDIAPPLAELGKRFKRYSVAIQDGKLSAALLGTFGDTSPAGAIRIPESLWGDPAHDRLLISEEDTRSGTAVREYDLAGRFLGRTIGSDRFKAQAEGISLWACPDGSGYWIATDQFKDRSLFHVFDRQSLEHLAAFSGEVVGNTDGVWLHATPSARFPNGAFYAVHDDMAVAAFDWDDIARATSLRASCTQ
jgi:3-phytase